MTAGARLTDARPYGEVGAHSRRGTGYTELPTRFAITQTPKPVSNHGSNHAYLV